MTLFRKIIFWIHLAVGIVIGLGVGMMAGTGAIMSFEHEIVDYLERGNGAPPTKDAAMWTPEDLLARARELEPDVTPTALTMSKDPTEPAVVQLGREKRIQLNVYTGERTGSEATKTRAFFHTVLELHRWITLSGEWRKVGRQVTGAISLGFLFLIVSGLWLWFPRKLKWSSFKPVLLFNWKLKGKTRDWNWHNVVGFWALVPLLIITLTGIVMSYPWANDLLYRAAKDTPPPRREERPRTNQAQAGNNGERPREGAARAPRPLNLEGLNDLWLSAEEEAKTWTSITMRLAGRREAPEPSENSEPADGGAGPSGAANARGGISFLIRQSDSGLPQDRMTLTFNRRTGELLRTETFADQSPGRRLRAFVLPIHRGEILGIWGQAIVFIASLSALLLVYTGFALSYRRLVRPVIQRIRQRVRRSPVDAEADALLAASTLRVE